MPEGRRRAVRPPPRLLEGADDVDLSSSSSEEDAGGARAAGAGRRRPGAAGPAGPSTSSHQYVYRFLNTRDISKDLEGETVCKRRPAEREGRR